MKVLGGDYGGGSAYIHDAISPACEIRFSQHPNKSIRISEVSAIELMNSSTSGTLGKAGLGAAAGLLLAGPVAGLAGMALGASGGKKTTFVFAVQCGDGRSLLLEASASEFAEVKSAFEKWRKKEKPARKAKKKPEADVRGVGHEQRSMIAGRKHLKAPACSLDLLVPFSEYLAQLGDDDVYRTFESQTISLFNLVGDLMWRYMDATPTADHFIDCAAYALRYIESEEERCGISISEAIGKSGILEMKAKEVKDSAWFFNRKAKLQEAEVLLAQAREEKSRYQAIADQRNSLMTKRIRIYGAVSDQAGITISVPKSLQKKRLRRDFRPSEGEAWAVINQYSYPSHQ